MPGPTSLVTLAETKIHLNIPSGDTSHETEIQGFIDDVQPVIEDIVGRVVQVAGDEWHDGGGSWVVLRKRPVLSVATVVEYSGNVAYTLTAAATPDVAGAYSYYVDGDRVIRRYVGAAGRFPAGVGNVHVTYTAGLAAVPANVRLGTLELVRHLYQLSQQGGRPAFGGAGEEGPWTPAGFAVPTRVIELLAPNRRYPSLA